MGRGLLCLSLLQLVLRAVIVDVRVMARHAKGVGFKQAVCI